MILWQLTYVVLASFPLGCFNQLTDMSWRVYPEEISVGLGQVSVNSLVHRQYSQGLRDSDILWKTLPGVSNVALFRIGTPFSQTSTTLFGKNMKVPCSGQDVSAQDFRRLRVLSQLQLSASRPSCQIGCHISLFRLT